MNTSFWTPYISDGTVKAICWTLIHSLWIGMVIALLCGIVIGTTRKSAAALRYRLLCGLLVLFVCAMGVTFYFEYNVPAPPPPLPLPAMVVNAQHNLIINQAPVPQNQTLIDSVQGFLNQNMSVIFVVWLLFFVLKSLKMVSGLLYIQRIRNHKISAVTEELKHRIEYLTSQIGIRRAVRLVQSELVKVPVAVGWLKPMILLPVGIAFQLTPEQLDGILWHELAHIRRRDYLVNILQGIVETAFFFNPGLLWLSSLIRTEREACCDDMVLSRMNRKANYLEALLSFGYGEFSQARFAMSIGSGNQLRDRLKRMISQENKRLSIAEKSVLAVGLVLLTAFTTISKDNPVIKHLTVKYTDKSGKVVTKTMPVLMRRLPKGQRADDSKPQNREKDTIVVRDTAIRFTSVLFKNTDADPTNSDISAMDDKGNKYHFIVADNKLVAMEFNGGKVGDDKLAGYEYMILYIDRVLADKRRVRADDIAAYKANLPTAKFKGKDSIAYNKKRYAVKGQSADAVEPKPYDKQRYFDGQEPDARYRKSTAMLKRMHDDSVSHDNEEQRAHGVIADLVREKVVPNAAAVKWFGLTDTELIVNGQKQPEALQQKLKLKYGVHEDYGLYYGPVEMTGRGVFIDDSPRPGRGERLMPKHFGSVQPNNRDSTTWKDQQLIKQQQLFAAEQGKMREQLQRDQQAFAANQNKKRQQITKQQQAYAADQDEKRQRIFRQQQDLLAEQNSKFRQQHPFKPGIDLQPAISGVIADLVSANVMNDKSDLIKFNLTNSALMVNGKKQPEELHDRLKAKYLEQPNYALKIRIADDPNFGLHFNAQSGAMGLGVTDGPDSP